MELKDIKTLISSGVILIAVALYLVFGDTPGKKDEATTTNTNSQTTAIISKSEVEQKTGHQAVAVEYVRTIDGDTIQVKLNGQKENVRMLLIDSPEMHARGDGSKQPFAQDATDFTTHLMEQAKKVTLIYDVGQERDKYGRLLAYVYADNVLVQEELLEQGLAAVRYIYKPNDSLKEEFFKLENQAKKEKLNVWSYTNYFQQDGFHSEVVK